MTGTRLLGSAVVGLALTVAFCCSSASAARRHLTYYAKATQVQYIDHSDDRARGTVINPFNTDVKTPPPRKTKDKEGSRPGDNALFRFTLYGDTSLKRKVGTAVYACTFNFDHQASCEGTFQLASGTMLANGPVDFDTKGFTIAVIGGSGSYSGARGQVSSAPARNGTNRLDFVLG
jgi:hypothetical protein